MAGNLTDKQMAALRINSLGYLAPKMRDKMRTVVSYMQTRHDPVVFETLRVQALQSEYFLRGTSRAEEIAKSMHCYGLAADVISKLRGWAFTESWQKDLLYIVTEEGLASGGQWKTLIDWPHIQWGKYPGVVPAELRSAFEQEGLYGAWEVAGAL